MIDNPADAPLDKSAQISTLPSVEEATNEQGGLTVREAAASLGVVAATIYLLRKQGKIRLIESSKGWLVPLDVLDMLRARWKR